MVVRIKIRVTKTSLNTSDMELKLSFHNEASPPCKRHRIYQQAGKLGAWDLYCHIGRKGKPCLNFVP